MYHFHTKENQCIYIYITYYAIEIYSVHISRKSNVYISLTGSTQYLYLIDSRHVNTPNKCPGICKISRFFDVITVSLFSYIGHQVSCDCEIEF